jgi:chromosome segregation ATPase
MAATDGQLSETELIEAAAARLALALDALDAAAERRREADRAAQSLADQLHVLGSDRARLASELDDAAARAKSLETANREVAGRIDQAIATIRGVLNSEEYKE